MPALLPTSSVVTAAQNPDPDTSAARAGPVLVEVGLQLRQCMSGRDACAQRLLSMQEADERILALQRRASTKKP